MLKLDTVKIMVGLLQMSSGRTQREKMADCLGDKASFPHLSLQIIVNCGSFLLKFCKDQFHKYKEYISQGVAKYNKYERVH